MKRRRFLETACAGAGALHLACSQASDVASGPPGNSVVAILKAASYSDDLLDRLRRGAQLCGLQAKGKRILLKPNLVEFESSAAINTHVSVVAAAVDLFRELGAAEVLIGEGPGHRRDTLHLAAEAGYRQSIARFDSIFTDLNRDDVSGVGAFASLPQMYLPNTARSVDLIVSLAKMKTHHWATATLSMKNYFGLVPGSLYGWPKNQLHQIGIHKSIAELNRIFPRSFAIVDGITGMEGNGPIQGSPKNAGVIVMGQDLIAVDATCCRIMGIDPLQIEYLQLAASRGHLLLDRIEQRGEAIAAVHTPFALIDSMRHFRLG
ncbi:MAG: DUF362 domain-containing protein [Bryobacteraceae bacterium]